MECLLMPGETGIVAGGARSRSGAKNAVTRERPSVLNGIKEGCGEVRTGLATSVTGAGLGSASRMELKYSATVSDPLGMNGRLRRIVGLGEAAV